VILDREDEAGEAERFDFGFQPLKKSLNGSPPHDTRFLVGNNRTRIHLSKCGKSTSRILRSSSSTSMVAIDGGLHDAAGDRHFTPEVRSSESHS
jgi:hypothetical protein